MKILQVIPHLGLGGAEIMCENLSEELINQNHQVTVVSLYTMRTPITDRLGQKNIKLVFLDKKDGLDIRLLGKIAKVIKQEKPDVIHTHLFVLKYVFAAVKMAGKKIPIVHTIHSVAQKEAPRADRLLAKFLYKQDLAVPVALSREVQKTIMEVYDLPEAAVPVVFNGLQLSKCMKKGTYTEGQTFKILHIGRFYAEKNHAGLLRAFQKVYKELPQCRLHLVGDGAKMQEIKALAVELGVADVVTFFGSQANVYPFLQEADMFILPSLYEGIPLTLIEAMGTGLPILATRVGGIPDMIEDEKTGLLVDVDASQLVEAIKRLATDQRLRENLGTEALDSAKRFSVEVTANRYVEIYQQAGK